MRELTLLHPDLAIAQVRWKAEGAGSPDLQTQGMGLRVLKHVGAAWQILAAQHTIVRASGK